jgi:hypothetical protein
MKGKKIKTNLKNSRTYIVKTLWALYYVNDNKNVDVEHAQIMHCIFCYNGPINASNPRTQARKGLISYCKINETTFFKNHVG